MAENYRNATDWVVWKPLDVQSSGTDVFDIYWGCEALVKKNEAGDWYIAGRVTRGYTVELPFDRLENASLEELTDAFFLTEGFTHDWLTAKYILAQPVEELKKLPVLLEKRTEEERRDFGGTMAGLYREYPAHTEEWVPQSDLRAAMGPYGADLDA